MPSLPRPRASIVLIAVLLASVLPLPGIWPLVAAAVLMVWALATELVLVAVVTDRPVGVVQPESRLSISSPRGPPSLACR